jgi:hypothetical protein
MCEDSTFYDICFKVVTDQDLNYRGKMTPEKEANYKMFGKMLKLFKKYFDSSNYFRVSCKYLSFFLISDLVQFENL